VVDMHTHTNHSDGMLTVEELLAKTKRLGIGISITDHNEVSGAVKAQRIKDNIMVIPGIEFHPYEGMHLLGYFSRVSELQAFYDNCVKKYLTSDKIGYLNINCEEIVECSKDYNALISAAHPFSVGWVGLGKHDGFERLDKKMIKRIDALEVINGGNLKRWNKKAIKLARETDSGITGGSDAHTNFEFGSVVTFTKEQDDVADFLESIRKKNNFVTGKQIKFFKKARIQYSKFSEMHMNKGMRIKTGWTYVKQNKYVRNKRRVIDFKNRIKEFLKEKIKIE